MPISHRLRRLAALLLLVPLSAAFQPVAAAEPERTQTANTLKVVSLSTPPEGLTDVPKVVRGDMLLASDGNIYFASSAGGKGYGAIGRLAPDGTLSVTYAFANASEGLTPFAGLTQASDGHLYGTTYLGGEDTRGTVFQLKLPAAGSTTGEFKRLYQFTEGSTRPQFPYTGVTEGPDGFLYGTTRAGGRNKKGTIFRIDKEGAAFSVVHHFDDGKEPQGRLILGDDGRFYGTTMQGGSRDRGTIYRFDPATNDYQRLYSFPGLTNFNSFGIATNSTGANPRAGLVKDPNIPDTFYGTAYQGGSKGNGTVYRVTVDGGSADVEVLHHFAGWPFDAGFPLATPVLDAAGQVLYGTSETGGYTLLGALWRVGIDGSGMQLLHSFNAGVVDGAQPRSGVLFANGALYGVSSTDDVGGGGAIFKLVQPDGADALKVNISISAKEVERNQTATITWNAPGAETCDKFGAWNEPADVNNPEHITPISGTKTLDPADGVYSYGLACTFDESGVDVTYNGYVGLSVTAPPLDPVDGGQIVGGGETSLLLLAFLAALLARKFIKETRSKCP